NACQLHSGQGEQVHADRDIEFTHDGEVVFLKEEIVGKYASGDGILYGHYGEVGRIILQRFAQLMEREALHGFDRLLEIGQRRHLVKAGGYSLYGDPGFLFLSHRWSVPFFLHSARALLAFLVRGGNHLQSQKSVKRKSPDFAGLSLSLYCLFNNVLPLKSLPAPKEIVISVIESVVDHHLHNCAIKIARNSPVIQGAPFTFPKKFTVTNDC